MRIELGLLIIILVLLNCKNETKTIEKNSFYNYQKLNDSLSVIKWGTESFENTSEPIETFLLDEKTYEKWRNERFICLTRSLGSDNKFDIILPLNKNAKNKYISNSLAYDKKNGKVIYEDGNILTVQNLNNNKTESIGDEFIQCESLFIHYCIDSINISENKVYIEWVAPNKIDEPNNKEIKKISIKI